MKKNYIRKLIVGSLLPFALLINLNTASANGSENNASLYQRLGGYNAIVAVVDDLFPRLTGDKKLGRFWAHRGNDGIAREKQFLINFIVAKAGGPLYYKGREMKVLHVGMKIDEQDWKVLTHSLKRTLDKFHVAAKEQHDVFAFIESTKRDIVELK